MSNVANIPGTLIPGTKVQASFRSFPGSFPELYDKAHHGSLNLASVNAGNSNTLCVGLGGVNWGFYAVLTGAGQKSANLNPAAPSGNNKPCSSATAATAADDYQGRHLRLLAKAGTGSTASETYPATDPASSPTLTPPSAKTRAQHRRHLRCRRFRTRTLSGRRRQERGHALHDSARW